MLRRRIKQGKGRGREQGRLRWSTQGRVAQGCCEASEASGGTGEEGARGTAGEFGWDLMGSTYTQSLLMVPMARGGG